MKKTEPIFKEKKLKKKFCNQHGHSIAITRLKQIKTKADKFV